MSFKEFIKEHIINLYSNKEYLTREIYINIYSRTYDFCTAKVSFKSDVTQFKKNLYSERLDFYNFVTKNIEEICDSISYKLLNSNDIIELYNKEYKNFLICSKILDNILEYFNRVFITEGGNENFMIILSKCKNIWLTNVIEKVSGKLNHKILSTIQNERDNHYSCDLYPIKKLLESFVELHLNIINNDYKELDLSFDDNECIYKKYFEEKYLKSSKEYYNFITSKNSIEEYIDTSRGHISFEQEICNNFLNKCTYNKITSCCIKNFIRNNDNFIYEELVKSLTLEKDIISEKIYDFYYKYCKDTVLRDENSIISLAFLKYCTMYLDSNLKNILTNKETDFKTFIRSIVESYNLFLNKIKLFKDNKIIVKSFENLFKKHINQDSNRYCNNISKYLNFIIKSCIKENEDIDENKEYLSIMNIIKFTNDKDYLENYFIRYLSQRLLNNTSLEYEYQVSRKLKLLFGCEFTNKMNTMISDINVSKSLSDEYKGTSYNKSKKKFTPLIATHFIWKLPKSKTVEYPSDLTENMSNFSKFYDSKFRGRKLLWNNNFIKGEIACYCFNKTYIFNASLNQINILNKFNNKNSYPLNFFDPESFNENALESLIKIKMLKKTDNAIELNLNFKSKKIRQNIYNLETKKEVKKNNDVKIDMSIDRSMLIQSCLVRVMKTRKKLDHNQLITQTMSQIEKFCPKVSDVKKNIEKLIDKEYIERDTENRNMYNYLA